jgi:hypothetical protein
MNTCYLSSPGEPGRIAAELLAARERIAALESAIKKHHTGIGCVNYCRTCGGHFSWENPNVAVSFPASGEAKP